MKEREYQRLSERVLLKYSMKRAVLTARADFPLIMAAKVYGKDLCYLDSAATAQKPLRVIELLDTLHRECNANIHRGVYQLSEEATARYESARERVANFLGASSVREVIFTSGATASLNTAAYSLGEMCVERGDNIVVSEMEHHSNIVPWQLLAERKGAELRVIGIEDDGALGSYDGVIDSRTKVVAITQASNVLGTMPELRPLIDYAHSYGAVVVVDGCQGVVHSRQNMKELGADLYAFSAHKLYGPTGVGVLWGREELLDRMPPFLGGGDMISSVSLSRGTTWAELPLKFEAGTSNFIGAIGLGEAIDYLAEFDFEEVEAYERALCSDFEKGLLERVEGVTILGTTAQKCPLTSFVIEGVSSYDLAAIVDKMGVAVRSGQLCAEPLLERFGRRTVCRASWGIYNNSNDNAQALAAIERAVKMLRR